MGQNDRYRKTRIWSPIKVRCIFSFEFFGSKVGSTISGSNATYSIILENFLPGCQIFIVEFIWYAAYNKRALICNPYTELLTLNPKSYKKISTYPILISGKVRWFHLMTIFAWLLNVFWDFLVLDFSSCVLFKINRIVKTFQLFVFNHIN